MGEQADVLMELSTKGHRTRIEAHGYGWRDSHVICVREYQKRRALQLGCVKVTLDIGHCAR